jgi:ankyrin repeat protein
MKMKHLFPILFGAVLIVSCSTEPTPVNVEVHIPPDGAGARSSQAAASIPKTYIAPAAGAFSVQFGTYNGDFLRTVKDGDFAGVEKQLAFKQNPNTVDSLDNSALMYAVDAENASIAQLLLSQGGNANLANKQKQTPLLYAVAKNNYNLAEMLVAGGAVVSQTDVNGNTPVLLAVQNRNQSLVQFLITRDARINDRDRNGNTALHIAAVNDDVAVANTLLRNGADPYATNSSGVTPLDVMERSSHPDMKNILDGYK